MNTSMNIKSLLTAILCLLVLFTTVAFAEEPVERKYSAVGRQSVDFGVGAEKQKIEFKFDSASAWLRENGTFHVEAEVKHESLLCGTYEVGVRFGIGKPGCTNVSWLSKTQFVSKRKQCNHAWMSHQGSGTDVDLIGDVDLVTCGQLVVRCNGKCKTF